MVRYEDLTAKQRKKICNGCGTKWLDVPDLYFKEDCDRHDVDYWKGGNERDRDYADRKFMSRMVQTIKRRPWYERPYLFVYAIIYYLALRFMPRCISKRSFEYGNQKTKHDLQDL